MGTIAEEIISKKLNRAVTSGEIVIVDVDYMMTHDNTTLLAINAWKKLNKKIKDRNKLVIFFDHAYPAPNIEAAKVQKQIVDFIKEQNIEKFYRCGVCHQVMIEEGFVKPGNVVIGADSHTNTYGAFGCFSCGFGSAELGVAWATGKVWLRVPETINIQLIGETQFGVTAKDVMLYIIGRIGMDGATYKSLEFSGQYIQKLSMHDRIVFSNMSTEAGAKCGLIAPDQNTFRFLESETNLNKFTEKITPNNPKYEKTIEIDVSDIEPQVACHPSVHNVRLLNDIEGIPIDEVFIGTCTNGRYEDLEQAANILKGRKVNKYTRCIITPASQRISDKAIKKNLYDIFIDAGCFVTASGCNACIGRHGGILAPGEKAFTTMNRNFIGRMGSKEAEIYLGSPLSAAATAIEGKITDPRKYI